MNTSDKKEFGFDVREIPESTRNKNRNNRNKNTQNPYAEKYMEDKIRIVIKDNVTEMLRHIKDKRKFNSDNDTVKWLCDIEKELSTRNLIEDFAVCKDCDTPINAKLDSYEGILHQHIDSKSNCFGCITTKYRVKPGLSDTKEQKDELKEQIEKKDEPRLEMTPDIVAVVEGVPMTREQYDKLGKL